MNSLIDKYNIPGPRYTSYPTVPYWDNDGFTSEQWQKTVIQSFNESNAQEGISIYIHLPFCEQLCTFCACHKRITKQHSVETPYLESVLKEWNLYLDLFSQSAISNQQSAEQKAECGKQKMCLKHGVLKYKERKVLTLMTTCLLLKQIRGIRLTT